MEKYEIARPAKPGDASAKRLAQPPACGSPSKRVASLDINTTAAAASAGLHAHGMPSALKGASTSANPGQYVAVISPLAETMIQR